MYDIIIIGAGPAGLTAAIFAARRALKVLVLSKGLGEQAILAPFLENYPGVGRITGLQLMQNMEREAKSFGVEIVYDEIIKIEEKRKVFVVKSKEKQYEAKAIILALGKSPKQLNAPGEKEFKGKGISYCATCDAPLFKNKTVAMIGGGDAALDAALLASKISKKVFLVHRRDEFRGCEHLAEKIKKLGNVELVLSSVVTAFKGDRLLRAVEIENVKTKQRSELKVDGAFVEIGSEVKSEWIKHLVKTDEKNQIVVNSYGETSHPGIFAAGDATNLPFKQIVVAAGDGAKAALQAYNYINGIKADTTSVWTEQKV